jgi:hypothetical protein
MSPREILGLGLAALSLLTLTAKCSDPGAETKPGSAHHVTIRVGSGMVVSKSNYGMWKAGESASSSCRWTLKEHGKLIGSGGPHDRLISTPSIKGAKFWTNCGWFYK